MKESEKYPWYLLLRTILVCNSFLALGVNDAVRGPTLLDLKDTIGATLGQTSFIVMLSWIGSLIGCILTGIFMDKLLKFRYLILAVTLLILGVFNALLPYSPSLFLMYANSFMGGLGGGSLETGANVLILDIWTGRDSGPYMHAAHFSFGLGAFLAPVISRPFLINTQEVNKDMMHTSQIVVANNSTNYYDYEENELIEDVSYETNTISKSTIKVLYPILGSYAVLLSIWFMAYFIKDSCKETSHAEECFIEKKGDNVKESFSEKNTIFIVTLMCIYFCFYAGMEVVYGNFVSVFAVKSKLKFSRKSGSDVAAVFWGSFAITRGLAIFAAIVAKPGMIMACSLVSCLVGSLMLCLLAESGLYIYIGSGLLGVGMASLFATGFLWLERRINVTNKIGASITVASSAGAIVFPVLVGQLIEYSPMSFMFLTASIVVSCTILFVCIYVLADKKIKKKEQDIDGEDNICLNTQM